MLHLFLTLAVLALTSLTPPVIGVVAQTTSALQITVVTVEEIPVADVSFALDTASGASLTAHTDTQGVAVIRGLPGASVRIRTATLAGAPLKMDANHADGTLHIPLLIGETQSLTLHTDGQLLFVAPAPISEGPVPSAFPEEGAPTSSSVDIQPQQRVDATAPTHVSEVAGSEKEQPYHALASTTSGPGRVAIIAIVIAALLLLVGLLVTSMHTRRARQEQRR